MDIELQKIKIFIISKVGKNWVIIQSKVYKNKYWINIYDLIIGSVNNIRNKKFFF